jgi:hypothetical protein
MKRSGSVWLATVALGISLVGAACTRPPEKEINEAEGAMKAATDAGADKYATSKFNEANTAMSDAKNKMAAKDYKAARLAARVAKAKFETATSKVPEGRAQVKTEVEGNWKQVTTAVTDIETKIPKMKLSKDEKTKMIDAVAKIKESLGTAKTALNSGDMIGAREKVTSAKNSLDEMSQMTQEKK